MTSTENQVKNFVQEILKSQSLLAAEQLSSLALRVFGERAQDFNIPKDKKDKLNELLRELNEEIQAARDAHEAGLEKPDGYRKLFKPFTDIFNYLSENIHENRAKELATEAAKLFLKETTTQLIKDTITENTVIKLKDAALSAIKNNNNINRGKQLLNESQDKIKEYSSKAKDKAKDKIRELTN